jgi:hypothetical protein
MLDSLGSSLLVTGLPSMLKETEAGCQKAAEAKRMAAVHKGLISR